MRRLLTFTLFVISCCLGFGQNDSSNGYVITPSGEVRMLVVYVTFDEYDTIHQINDWRIDDIAAWNQSPDEDSFPQFMQAPVADPNTGKLIWGHEELTEFSTLGNPPADAKSNASEYYFHMSDGDFKVMFETIKDPFTGKPKNIVIDPTGLTSWPAANAAAIDQIGLLYPGIDWSRYDLRENKTGSLWDNNNANTIPDKVLDYVIFIYRNRNDWAPHPNGDVDGSEWPKGVAGVGVNKEIGNTGYRIKNGLSYFQFENGLHRRLGVIIHENGHNFFDASHYARANFVHARYFYSNFNWSTMLGYRHYMSLSNAWERWYQGWIDITHDIDENSPQNVNYTLGDYMDTSETMRVKLPHTLDQYIWLEYHANTTNPFYTRPSWNTDGDGNLVPRHPAGLYGFVERVAPTRMDVNRFEYGANGIKTIYRHGNHDYVYEGIYPRSYYYNQPVLNVTNEGANPYGGHHESSWFRHDFEDPFNEITYMTGNNGGGGTTENEGMEILEVDGEKVWGFMGLKSALPMSKMSAFTNPALTNFQEFDKFGNRMAPIFLHSMSIEPVLGITDKKSTGATSSTITLKVNYSDGHIEDDFRMTGNIYIPGSEDIVLDPDKELLINRTQTVNLVEKVNGSFYNPTVMIASDGSSFTFDTNSTTILDEGSTVIFEGGSTLDMRNRTEIYIRGGSLLCIKEDAITNLAENARIYVEDGFLYVHPSIDISNHVLFTNDNITGPQIQQSLNYCTVNSAEHQHSIEGTNVSGIACPGGSVILATTDKVRLTSDVVVEIFDEFEAPPGSYFDAYITSVATDCDVEFFFGTNGVPDNQNGNDEEKSFFPNQNSLDEPLFEIAIVPNPTDGIFEVKLSEYMQFLDYELMDFSGNVIEHTHMHGVQNFSITRTDLQPGVYLLKVFTN